MASFPARSKKFGVGKEIGGAIYVHRDFEGVLPGQVRVAKKHLPVEYIYTVVKFALSTELTSFIHSPDFDSADEPVVGEIVSVSKGGVVKHTKQHSDPYIYHHKWLFVDDGYEGFDVAASKTRSRRWLALQDVDKQRIGRLSYWRNNVVPRLETEC